MSKATVKIGPRVYDGVRSWKRRDVIEYGNKVIGVIHLSEHDRRGTTTCIATSRRKPGREIEWCVEESVRHHVIEPAGQFYFQSPHHQVAAAA